MKTTKVPLHQTTFKIEVDVEILETYLKFMVSGYANLYSLTKLRDLISMIDTDLYNYDEPILVRIQAILLYTEAVCLHSLSDVTLILDFIRQKHEECYRFIIENDVFDKKYVSADDARYVKNSIAMKLQSRFLSDRRDTLEALLNKATSAKGPSSLDDITAIREELSLIVSMLDNAGGEETLIPEFDFDDSNNMSHLQNVIEKKRKPKFILRTNVQYLNNLLSPGFIAGRLYCFIGGTGKFKSGTLLNVGEMIRKSNPQINAKENGKRKVVLFITMENTIEETLERMYDMYNTDSLKMEDHSSDTLKNVFDKAGQYSKEGDDKIGLIIQYEPNMSISTGDIYGKIKRLADNGKEVICVILDYLLRINSVFPSLGDEKVRLEHSAMELKVLAQREMIPVITAMQLNRGGNASLDAKSRTGGSSVDGVGASDIGLAWGIMQEVDFACIINPESNLTDLVEYLAFKLLKLRYAKFPPVTIFSHPFIGPNNVRLAPDIHLNEPLSVLANYQRKGMNEDRKYPSVNDVKKTKYETKGNESPKFASLNLDSSPSNVFDDSDFWKESYEVQLSPSDVVMRQPEIIE